ncbi:unnamed protein product [Gongylonema pulchrum]|uniref:Neur_chan_LBD domain-containing protein n=1 Tax=Gongylonema pulchrum TaxID=637853 RepID=A0A3P7M4U4_9BILA|nr:unnamed protein product [Gongylonema pulchrum]
MQEHGSLLYSRRLSVVAECPMDLTLFPFDSQTCKLGIESCMLQEHGSLLYSRRLSVVAECPMDLTLFPFDSQTCKLGIESYGYTADQVRYKWSNGSKEALKLHKIRLPDFQIKEAYVTNGYTADQVRYKWSNGSKEALKLHKIRLPDFQIKEAYVTSQIESYATGNYSRLYVCFVFTRAAGFCFLQLIIPSTAVVITSWDMISIILTITFLLFSYNEVMPRVSYIKAMDVYLGVCFCIVFFSLIKLAVVKYMRQRLRITRYTLYY